MHELALAEAVLAATMATAEASSITRVLRVEVHVGELQHIRRETFDRLLADLQATASASLRETEFAVTIQPARLRCQPCGKEFPLDEAGEQDWQGGWTDGSWGKWGKTPHNRRNAHDWT